MNKKNKILINISIVSLLIFLNIYGKINEKTIRNYLIVEQSSENNKTENFYNNITNVESLIYNLNLFINQTRQTNVIFADYFLSKVCYDKSAFTLFEYYLNENIDVPYYIVNIKSEFYMSLLKQNKTKNLILFNPENISLFYKNLFYYLKDAKIIVNAYTIHFLQIIAGNVPYIKFLKINHGIKYFKIIYAKTEFNKALGKKKMLFARRLMNMN